MKYFTLGKPQASAADAYSPAGEESLLMGVFYKNLDNTAPITDTPVEAIAAYASEYTGSDDLSDSTSNTGFVTDDNNVIVGQNVIQLFGIIRSDASLYGGTYSASYSLFAGATDAASAVTGFFCSVTGDLAGQPWPFGDVHIWTTTNGYANRKVIRADEFLTGVNPSGIGTSVGFATTAFGVPDAVRETVEVTQFEEAVGNSGGAAAQINLVHVLVEGYNVTNSTLTSSMTNPVS
tara:strand:- start:2804 stop:3508 length:705 start_codon:yes stop_codon:yes gene_type:complete